MERAEAAREVLRDMPPFPGGDPNHFHPDFEQLFAVGVGGLLAEIAERRKAALEDGGKRVFYDACRIALEGMAAYIRRVAEGCRSRAQCGEREAAQWRQLAAICQRLASEPPDSFHEAIQMMFLTQVALWFGDGHILTAPGRMDRTLWRFYEADLASGRMTRREAFELIACLYIQQNRLLHTGSAISVIVGGRDPAGRDVTNELTYLCLAARLATRLSYPTVGLAWHERLPPELMDFCVRAVSRGMGDPAFFNDELIVSGLREHGVGPADATNYMNSTCVEIKVVGRSNIWVTHPYFNLPAALLGVMEAVALERETDPESYAALSERVRRRIAEAVRGAADEADRIWWEREERGGFPLASCLVLDCLQRGLDFDRGGARYNWVENSFVGLANLVDSLIAVRDVVYERRELTLAEFSHVLARDFVGDETLRQRILYRLPKYGNDDRDVDAMACEWAQFLIETTESKRVGGHRYVPGFFSWIMHEKLGASTGATPDGRLAGWPLADGAGPAQGRERCGPTAAVLSTTAWCHRRALGGLVHNVKVSGRLLQDEHSRTALADLVRTYMRRGGFEIQVNVVSNDTLRAAQAHPEQYGDLVVRVAGYSDYFVKLSPSMQDEIIARTEHAL
jgi:formate C-acetyltransferase